MPLRLKSNGTTWPPNGYPYVDSRTGKKFDGMSADLDMQVANVITHRKANPRVYPPDQPEFLTPASVKGQVIAYICALRPELCVNGEDVKTQTNLTVQQPNKVCPKCKGTVFSPNYCKTCGGNKIKSWSCVACGTNVGK